MVFFIKLFNFVYLRSGSKYAYEANFVCVCGQSDGEAPSLLDGMGRIAYEQSGETFFLPFGLEDIEVPGSKMQPDDQVEFFISTDEK